LRVAEGIEEADGRAWALKEIAEGMARVGKVEQAMEVFNQALRVAEGIEEANRRARALGEIVEEMVWAGEVEGAVGIIEREMVVRTKMLPSVLSALVERARKGDEKSKGGFLRLLPWCGWSLELSYQACGLLAWLYPEHGVRIAEKIIGENLSG
jgi:ribosomal protein L17